MVDFAWFCLAEFMINLFLTHRIVRYSVFRRTEIGILPLRFRFQHNQWKDVLARGIQAFSRLKADPPNTLSFIFLCKKIDGNILKLIELVSLVGKPDGTGGGFSSKGMFVQRHARGTVNSQQPAPNCWPFLQWNNFTKVEHSHWEMIGNDQIGYIIFGFGRLYMAQTQGEIKKGYLRIIGS